MAASSAYTNAPASAIVPPMAQAARISAGRPGAEGGQPEERVDGQGGEPVAVCAAAPERRARAQVQAEPPARVEDVPLEMHREAAGHLDRPAPEDRDLPGHEVVDPVPGAR